MTTPSNNYLRPPKGERSDTPAAHVASVRGEGVTAYMTTDGNEQIGILNVFSEGRKDDEASMKLLRRAEHKVS